MEPPTDSPDASPDTSTNSHETSTATNSGSLFSSPRPEAPATLLRRHSSKIPRSPGDAFRSFQNLVALANDQERWKITKVAATGKQFVWRDVGEPPVLLERLRECAEHAGTGGFRAGVLGFAGRSGVNLIIFMFTIRRVPKRKRGRMLLKALFGMDSLQFGAMLGTFVVVYKFILNALPILRKRRLERTLSQTSVNLRIDIPPPPDPEAIFNYPQSGSPMVTTNSDFEHGLSMGVLNRHPKSVLKTPLPGESTGASLAPSQAMSRAGSPSPSGSGNPQSADRHARFADDANLIQGPCFSMTLDRAVNDPGHLSDSIHVAYKLMRDQGYVYERWHATLAGAVAGALAILMERKSRRLGYAQQLFVRGLQGSFNHWSERLGIVIPFGSVLTFAFCCGQIMYGFLLRPDTIPRSYEAWIQRASIVPQDAVTINRKLAYGEELDISLMERLKSEAGKAWNGAKAFVTPHNKTVLAAEIQDAIMARDPHPPIASCAAIHPHHDSCIETGLWRIYEAGIWMAPMYGALHFIPMILFKRKKFFASPFKMILKAALGTLRSATFLGTFVAIYQSYICFLHFLYILPLKPHLLLPFRKLIMSKPAWWLGGLLSGLSLLVEDERRRVELAMYVLPKGLESGWKHLRGELFGIPTKRQRGWKSDVALCAAGMGMLMSTYQHSPQHLSGMVRRLLYQFVGPN